MARNRSVLLSPSSSATVKPRQKISLALTLSFSKIFTLAFFFFFFYGKNKNCLTTRFWFLRSSFASRAIYKKRERYSSRVDTPTKRKQTAEKTSRSLELALRGFQSRDKFKNERERERGFIIENSKIQERNAQQKKSYYYYYY